MNEIQTPEAALKLIRKYGLRERFPLATVAPELQPVVIVDDLTAASAASRKRDAWASLELTSALPGIPHFGLVNGRYPLPTASLGTNLELTRMVISRDGGGALRVFAGVTTALPQPAAFQFQNGQYSDYAVPPGGGLGDPELATPASLVGFLEGVVRVPNPRLRFYMVALDTVVIPLDGIIVPPLAAFWVVPFDEAGNTYQFSIFWKERPREPQLG